jgi:glycosyltransferase involved in cell wall biosynthesis
MKLSLVVPAFNEAGVVGDSVRRIDSFLRECGWSYEIVLGDDGSTDGTADEVRGLDLDAVRVVRRPHRGKGAILTDALLATEGRFAGFIDADLEIDVDYLPRFVEALDDGFDVAVASKTLDPAMNRHRRLSRRVTTAVYNFLVRTLFRSPLSDHQAGLKLFRGDLVRGLLPEVTNEGWLWDTEVLVACLRAGCAIEEIPVEAVRRREGHVGVVTTSWAMLRDLIGLYLSMNVHPSDGPSGEPRNEPTPRRLSETGGQPAGGDAGGEVS